MTILKAGRKRRLWVVRILFLANILAGLLLLVSILASYISPALAWFIALFGIAYPFFLVLNILFFFFWIFKKRFYFLISLGFILLGYPTLRKNAQLNFFKEVSLAPENSFKFLSFNTRLFDLYNWSKEPDTKSRIFHLLETESPDILCMQEFYTSVARPGLNNLDSLKKLLRVTNVHVAYTETKRGTDHWGIATFSKYPILKRGNILFNETSNNLCIYTDVKIKADTVRIYNAHFQSNRFKREDYEFLGNPEKQKEKLLAFQSLLERLKIGSIKRSGQVDVVANHIANSPYPVIISGDFNDPPSSYTYNKISNNLQDAFLQSGSGFGNTYNGLIPLLRIDYILHDKQIDSDRFEVIKQNLSDHYPISCLMRLPKP